MHHTKKEVEELPTTICNKKLVWANICSLSSYRGALSFATSQFANLCFMAIPKYSTISLSCQNIKVSCKKLLVCSWLSLVSLYEVGYLSLAHCCLKKSLINFGKYEKKKRARPKKMQIGRKKGGEELKLQTGMKIQRWWHCETLVSNKIKQYNLMLCCVALHLWT